MSAVFSRGDVCTWQAKYLIQFSCHGTRANSDVELSQWLVETIRSQAKMFKGSLRTNFIGELDQMLTGQIVPKVADSDVVVDDPSPSQHSFVPPYLVLEGRAY